LTFPTSSPGVFVGLDEQRNLELYRLYWVRDVGNEWEEKKDRCFRMFADDVNMGLGEYELTSVKKRQVHLGKTVDSGTKLLAPG